MAFYHPDYTVIKELGRGASATVYLAVQKRLNRKVALKVINDPLTVLSGGSRFLREARILARLDHPNIVPVHELTELFNDDGTTSGYLMVMSYIGGGTLAQRINELCISDVLSITGQIANALGYAHKHGFVHRDVKPDNILFQGSQALLADFGIARAAESQTHMTQHGVLLGTPIYMSPEQINSEPIDARTDLYSLGVVLFEMIAGYPPYQAETAIATSIQHLTHPVPPLPEAMQAFQPLIDGLLEKDPSSRIASTEEVTHALSALAERLRWPGDRLVSDLRMLRSAHSRALRGNTRSSVSRFGSSLIVPAVATLVSTFTLAVLLWWRQPADTTTTTPAPDSVATSTPGEFESAQPTSPDYARLTATAIAQENWFDGPESAVELYRKWLQSEPGNNTAARGLQTIREQTQREVERAIEAQQWPVAKQRLASLLQHWPDHTRTRELGNQLQNALAAAETSRENRRREQQLRVVEQQIAALLDKAHTAQRAGHTLMPPNNNAAHFYQQILQLDQNHSVARRALSRLQTDELVKVRRAIRNGELTIAEQQLAAASLAFPNDRKFAFARQTLEEKKNAMRNSPPANSSPPPQESPAQLQQRIASLEREVERWRQQPMEIALQNYDALQQAMLELQRLAPRNTALASLREDAREHWRKLRLPRNDSDINPDNDDDFRLPGF